jgi:hypothetical protein
MLTLEQFDSLEPGDLIETSPLMKALTEEPVILHTDKRVTGKTERLEFVATYLGVTLGRWTCTKKEGKLEWQTS